MKFSAIAALAALGLFATSAASAAAPAKEAKPPIAIPAPPPGKGQIVFFRTGSMMGMALGCSVNENGQKISSLGAGKYFIMVATPGRHEYTVKSEAKDVLALEVEPDETQFASCKIKMGIMAGRPDIRPSTEAEFRKHPGLKMVDVDDMGPAPGALRAEEVAAALASPPAAAPAPVAESAPAPAAAEVPAAVPAT